MEQILMSNPWGDCPGLDHGPRSREHESRFVGCFGDNRRQRAQSCEFTRYQAINRDNRLQAHTVGHTGGCAIYPTDVI
jgi:hypothetical protein